LGGCRDDAITGGAGVCGVWGLSGGGGGGQKKGGGGFLFFFARGGGGGRWTPCSFQEGSWGLQTRKSWGGNQGE